MGAVRFLVLKDLRTRWRSWAATALLVGLLGGAALAADSGARRTQTAYSRMVKATREREAGDPAALGNDCVNAVCLRRAQRPGQVSGYAGVRTAPLVLAALLGALAAATLVHTLVTSVRCRRRDLAILKTVGFVRHQLSAAVAWQSTTITTIALMAGLPLGLIAGAGCGGSLPPSSVWPPSPRCRSPLSPSPFPPPSSPPPSSPPTSSPPPRRASPPAPGRPSC